MRFKQRIQRETIGAEKRIGNSRRRFSNWQLYGAHGLLFSLPHHHLLALSLPPSAMTHGEYDYDLDVRPVKRPRQLKEGDDGHRPFIPMSGASGVQAEGDNAGEGGPKKGRKRPLSCGECRRCVYSFYLPPRSERYSLFPAG